MSIRRASRPAGIRQSAAAADRRRRRQDRQAATARRPMATIRSAARRTCSALPAARGSRASRTSRSLAKIEYGEPQPSTDPEIAADKDHPDNHKRPITPVLRQHGPQGGPDGDLGQAARRSCSRTIRRSPTTTSMRSPPPSRLRPQLPAQQRRRREGHGADPPRHRPDRAELHRRLPQVRRAAGSSASRPT